MITMYNNWKNITRDELLKIYVENDVCDSMVADMFGVTKSQVVSKRRKLNITQSDMVYEKYIKGQEKELLKSNKKQYILEELDIDTMSKAFVNYIFRFGPVEDMHSKGQLSQDDMKTLNKYMNDRIATLIYLFRNEDWNRLFDFFGAITKYNPKWDRAEILIEEIDKISGRK